MTKRGGAGEILILALVAGCAPPFMRGVASGHMAKVEAELAHGADVNARDAHGNTPRIVAALNGHNHVAALLIAHGADVNGQNARGGTPLMAAAHKGHASLAAWLLAHGAYVNPRASRVE
ncbi:MAG: ankyrin repeat domain-containing protein [Acidiferrobacteraceae bacterium]